VTDRPIDVKASRASRGGVLQVIMITFMRASLKRDTCRVCIIEKIMNAISQIRHPRDGSCIRQS